MKNNIPSPSFSLSEDIRELILGIYEKDSVQNIVKSSEFYFQKAVDKFREFEEFRVPETTSESSKYFQSEAPIEDSKNIDIPFIEKKELGFYESLILEYKEFYEKGGPFGEFLEKKRKIEPVYQILLLIGELIAYFDLHAYNKNIWNEYEDKRVLARSGVRQPYWVINLLVYKAKNHDLEAISSQNIKNALRFILNPEREVNIFSDRHRTYISERLLNSSFVSNTFIELLFNTFGSFNFTLSNQANIGVLYARILYDKKLRTIWSEGTTKKKEGTEKLEKELTEEEAVEKEERESLGKIIADITGVPVAKADTVAKEDLLGRERLVNAISDIISFPEKIEQFTIGIFGDWGSGKSSILELVEKRLAKIKKPEFLFTTFNAWAHEHLENMHAGLAQKTVEGLTSRLGFVKKIYLKICFAIKEHGVKFWFSLTGLLVFIVLEIFVIFKLDINEIIRSILGVAGASAIIYLGNLFSKIYQHPIATDLMTYLKLPDYGEYLGLVPVLKRHLKTLANLILNENKRLVIFVDDLDRCKNNNILKIFEAVRLLMDIPDVIVIIAIDARIALEAISKEYSELSSDERSSGMIAGDYLGKIIQLPIQLLPPEEKEIDNFIRKALFEEAKDIVTEEKVKRKQSDSRQVDLEKPEDVEYANEEEYVEKIMTEESTRKEVVGESIDASDETVTSEVMKDTIEELEYFIKFTNLFRIINPRQIIRLRNSYRFLKILHPNEYAINIMLLLFLCEYTSSNYKKCDLQEDKIMIDEKLYRENEKLINELQREIEELEIQNFKSLAEKVRQCILPRKGI